MVSDCLHVSQIWRKKSHWIPVLRFSPEFLSSSFEGRVFETAAVGTSIVQVQAIDRDHDKNAEIKYSILSGKNVCLSFSPDFEQESLRKIIDYSN